MRVLRSDTGQDLDRKGSVEVTYFATLEKTMNYITHKNRSYPYTHGRGHITVDLHDAGCVRLWLCGSDDKDGYRPKDKLEVTWNDTKIGTLPADWVDCHTARQTAHMMLGMVSQYSEKMLFLGK